MFFRNKVSSFQFGKFVIKTALLVSVPLEQAICFPSGDHAKEKMVWSLKCVICCGSPLSKG
jgi:hypothetical protein